MLHSVVVDVAELGPDIRRDMYDLFERYYLATSPERFERYLWSEDTVFLAGRRRASPYNPCRRRSRPGTDRCSPCASRPTRWARFLRSRCNAPRREHRAGG